MAIGGSALMSVRASPGSAQEVGELQAVLGAADRPEQEVFGRIKDVLVDATGRVLILDELTQLVSAFGSDLEWLGSAGGPGQGPEELGPGLAAALSPSGEIVIADFGNGRLARYGISDEGPHLLETTLIPLPAVDVCVVDGRVFVLTIVLESLVHEIGADGQVVASFGRRVQPKGELARQVGDDDRFHNHVELTCDEETQSIILAHKFIPLVRAYSTAGAELWSVELSDYHQQQFQRASGVCCAYMIPNPFSKSYHIMDSALSMQGGVLLLSLREEGPESTRQHELRKLNIRTGAETGRVQTPGVLMATGNGFAYFAREDPYPQVLVHLFWP
jgi:hypothetical protein